MFNKYPIILAWSSDGDEYVATSPQWDGLSGVHEDPCMAVAILCEAIAVTAQAHIDDGEPVPKPYRYTDEERLRLNKSLVYTFLRSK